MNGVRRPLRAAPPWWLAVGPRACAICELARADELESHCVDCDRPLCALCVIERRGDRALLCIECFDGVR